MVIVTDTVQKMHFKFPFERVQRTSIARHNEYRFALPNLILSHGPRVVVRLF